MYVVVQCFKTNNVIVNSIFICSVFIFANVATDNDVFIFYFWGFLPVLWPVIVESHSIDQGVVKGWVKETNVALGCRAGLWSNSANFNKSQSQGLQYVNPFTIFIETSCQANIIGQLQAIDPKLFVGGRV